LDLHYNTDCEDLKLVEEEDWFGRFRFYAAVGSLLKEQQLKTKLPLIFFPGLVAMRIFPGVLTSQTAF